MKGKRGQAMIEAVIYMGIGLMLISIVLAIAIPKINQMKEEAIIEQTEGEIKRLNSKIYEVIQGGSGNLRKTEFSVKGRGEETNSKLKIDGKRDLIIFEILTDSAYSEPGENFTNGKLEYLTEEKNEKYKLKIFSDYKEFNLTVQGKEKIGTMEESPSEYLISVSNKGKINSPENNQTVIDFNIE